MPADSADDNSSKPYDGVIIEIVDYAYDYDIQSLTAWVRAKATLLDALGAAFESLHTSTECAQLVGPTFPGTAATPGGFRLPGTNYHLDILKGAFDLGSMIRYLDHNDAFPGAEWGHPSGPYHSLTQILVAHLLSDLKLNNLLLLQITSEQFLPLQTSSPVLLWRKAINTAYSQ